MKPSTNKAAHWVYKHFSKMVKFAKNYIFGLGIETQFQDALIVSLCKEQRKLHMILFVKTELLFLTDTER